MSAEDPSSADRPSQVLPALATAVIVIGFVNFFWFISEAMAFGTARSGEIIDGRYFLNNKSIYTEVGQAMWVWSQIHEASLVITHPLAIAGMAYLSLRRASAARERSGAGASWRFREWSTRYAGGIPGIDPRLSKVLEVVGLLVGVVLVASGVLWAIPRLGGFGLLWTIGAAAILGWNAWRFLRRNRSGVAPGGNDGQTGDAPITFGLLALGVVVILGLAGVTAILSAPVPPPAGRAAFVPDHPRGPHVYLAPIGTFPTADLDQLVAFYAVRYDLDVEVLPSAPTIPPTPGRNQIDADGLESLLQSTYREAKDSSNVVIGVVSDDIFVPSRPDWHWAFGERDGRVAVISTYRMKTGSWLIGDLRQQTRLRKMVTRSIGFAYFGLPPSQDPQSVLYESVLGPMDLDFMGEDY